LRRPLVIAAAVIAVLLVGSWWTYQWIAAPPAPPSFSTPPTDLPADPPGTVLRSERRKAGRWSLWYPDTEVDSIVDVAARPFVDRIGRRCVATVDEGVGDVPDLGALELGFPVH
jgi:hypothetical protein